MINTVRPTSRYREQTAVSTGVSPETKAATQTTIKFWGVRGSVPTPTQAHQRYGGNTVCVEIKIGGQHIIFDGGTGLVGLGHLLSQQDSATHAQMLFTHTQWDRIQGFPFFQPAFSAKNRLSIYGGVAPNGASIKHCLTDQMLKPHFSMPLQNMEADLSFKTIAAKDRFYLGDVTVDTLETNTVSQAIAYRLTYQDTTVVYATDTPPGCIDPAFLEFADQADVLLYDGTYADLSYLKNALAETPSAAIAQPWEPGIEIAQKAQAKQLVLLHHSPIQDDDTLDQVQQDIQSKFPAATIAQEGMTINL